MNFWKRIWKLIEKLFKPKPDPEPEPNPEPIPLDEVTWLHTNVKDWTRTAELKSVTFSGNKIILDHSANPPWPGVLKGTVVLAGNAWIFVKLNDKWYGATWEWLRPQQKIKGKAAVKGDHIKQAPLHTFVPKVGETYGFMVSGLARDGTRNVKERSNVVMVEWK